MQVIIGVITGLLVAAIWAIGSYVYRRKKPIVVSPRSIELLGRKWETRSRFTVHNQSHWTFYSIIVKLTLGQGGIQSNEIDFDPVSETQTQESRIGDISVRTDIFIIDCTDEQGREAILISIGSLFPKETLSFVFRRGASGGPPSGQQARVSISLLDFKREPSPLLQGPEGVTWPFTVPENIRAKRVRLLMKRQS